MGMKYLGLILVVALIAGEALAFRISENYRQQERLERNASSKLRNILENLKTKLREGDKTRGIPPMDPFVGKDMTFELKENLVKGTVELKNFRVTGIAGYNVEKAEVSIFKQESTVKLTWPQIYSEGLHKGTVVIPDNVTIFGDGNYTLKINNLSIESVMKVKLIGGFKIKKMQTTIGLGSLELKATGLMGDEDVSESLSEEISEVAPQFVQDHQKELAQMVNEHVMEIVNNQLKRTFQYIG